MEFRDHNCTLPTQYKKEHVVNEWIETGIFIEARRALKKLTMVSGRHPYCKTFYRSSAAQAKEHERHLLTHPNMIHPFSVFALYWQFCMFWVYLMLLIAVSLHICITSNVVFSPTSYMIPLLNTFFVADMVLIFFFGYYDSTQNRVILSPSKVALRYLKTYLIFDLVSLVPGVAHAYLILVAPNADTKFMITLRFFNVLKLTRCISFFEIFRLIKTYFNLPSYIHMGLKILFTYLFAWLWSCATIYCVTNWQYSDEIGTVEEVIHDFYTGTLIFLAVNYGNDPDLGVAEIATHIVFMCLGFTFQLYLFAKVLQMWENYTSVTNKQDTVYQQVHECMKYKALPVNLRTRILCYLDFKYQKQFYNERKVSTCFSQELKQEIDMAIFQSYLAKLEIFYEIPIDIQVKILSTLQKEIYLPNDIIIRAGQEGSCMYIVLTGTVAIYTPSGKEVCHLEDGAHFGEIALVISHKRIATVVAVTACELFVLRRSDLLRILEPYPLLRATVFNTAARRYVETSKIDLRS